MAKTPSQSSGPTSGSTAPASANTSAGGANPASPTPLIASNHQPTPAQQNPQVKRPLAPSVAEVNPNAPADPIRAFQERSKAAIASRLKGHERAQIGGASVDGASTLPKARSAPASSTAGSPPASGQPPAATSQAGTSEGATGSASGASSQGEPAAKAKPGESSKPGTEGAPTSTPSSKKDDDDEASSSPASGDTSSVRENRYTFKDIKAWAEKNPEKAAEIRRIFDLGEDTDAPFIALQHKRRQSREELAQQRAEGERALKEQRDYIDGRVQYGETMAKQLQPLTDMFQAVNQRDEHGKPVLGPDGQPIIDFDMLDASVEATTGMKMDDIIRRRARRGASNPELAKERARAARAERELRDLRAQQQTNGAGAATTPTPAAANAPAPAPAAPGRTAAQAEAMWGPDVPKSHGLRHFAGWAAELDTEMSKYHDEGLNEYSVDTEVIADQLLQSKLALLRGVEAPEPTPAPAAAAAVTRPVTPKRRRRVLETGPDGLPDPSAMAPKGADGRFQPKRAATPGTVQDLLDPGSSEAPRGFAERERMAFANAEARLKGQPVPYPNLSAQR